MQCLLLDIQLVAMTPQFMIIYLLMKYRMSYTVPVCLAPAAICYYIIVRQSKYQQHWAQQLHQTNMIHFLAPGLRAAAPAPAVWWCVRYLAAACQS